MNYLSLVKWIGLTLLICGALYILNDWQYQKWENARKDDNFRQQAMFDSIKIQNLKLSVPEIKQTIDGNVELQKFIAENKISQDRITSILMQKYLYSDNTVKSTNMQEVLDAIKQNKTVRVPWKDSTQCMQEEGEVVFMNDTLLHKVTKRTFQNNYTAIGYMQRRQWNFLGIKTRIFGKLEATAVVKNDCGETKTISIEKK